MTPTEVERIFDKAIDTWGIRAQEDMMIEECSELIQSLCKLHRTRREGNDIQFDEAVQNVREELADVFIMWQQMEKVFNNSENDIGKIYLRKMERLRERLEPTQVTKESEA
jgi:hypothetical protein